MFLLMLNVELRMMKEEEGIRGLYQVPSTKYKVGIRVLTQIVLLRDHGTLYLVLNTWYLVLSTLYLL